MGKLPIYLEVLNRECAKSSIRNLAKDLNLSPSFLSRVLSGSRKLSEEYAFKIINHLNLDEKTKKEFLDSVHLAGLTLKKLKAEKSCIQKIIVTEENLHLFTEMEYRIIYSYLKHTGLCISIFEASELLKVDKIFAQEILEDLYLYKLSCKNENDLFYVEDNIYEKSFESEHVKILYARKILENASAFFQASEILPVCSSASNIVFSGSHKQLIGGQKLIEEFQQKLSSYLKAESKKTIDISQCYNLSIHMVPVLTWDLNL